MSDKEANKDLNYWNALHNVLKNARDAIPYADEPEHYHWDHPDDEWKNSAELEALEEECSSDTDDLVRHFCAKKAWPKRSKNNARHFAGKRMQWGLRFLRIFTIPVSEGTGAAIPRPPQSGWDLLEWLLIDAYHNRFPPPPTVPFIISGPDLHPPP